MDEEINKEQKDINSKLILEATRDFIHQMASPLVAAQGHVSNIIKGRIPQEDIKNRMYVIETLIQHSMRTLKNFQIISNIGTLYPTFQKGDIRSFLLERVKPFISQASHTGTNLIIQEEKNSKNSSDYFTTDFNILGIAVDNILDNAIRYSYRNTDKLEGKEEYSIIVSYAIVENTLKLKITNTGIPIKPNEISNIFSKFYRGDEAKMVTGTGSGIGLYISKKCIDSLEGLLEVSSFNYKTSFLLTLKNMDV